MLDLVLLHEGPGTPQDTLGWLDRLGVSRHFHIRHNNDDDWGRLARIIAGRGIGLVLSGGGARAYAHIGVLKAFAEAGQPVDFVGGTSMGAIIAAGVAAEWSMDEILERTRKSFVDTNPLSDYAFPLAGPFTGLVRGGKVERLLHESFGACEIADLWKPFFCVSSNLTSAAAHIHRRGPLCEALRASIALPGILPPVANSEGVLVDGGLLNNLPVDIMRAMNAGPIIAINVARDLALGPEALLHEAGGAWLDRIRRPPIVSILLRSATVTGEQQNLRQVASADLVIDPPLGAIEIRDWKAFDIGHAHTCRALERSGHLFNLKQQAPVA